LTKISNRFIESAKWPEAAAVFSRLSEPAWEVREKAYLFGKTAVGCALMTSSGRIYVGCNVEHRYRSHDIHAEVNAISSMVSQGDTDIRYLLVVADRERFTPCGACMDWIMQFASENCLVAFQPKEGGPSMYWKQELMPFYPS
jgi:cytidine deaminase